MVEPDAATAAAEAAAEEANRVALAASIPNLEVEVRSVGRKVRV